MDEYQRWADVCKTLKDKEVNFYFKEREVWWCHLGENIGFEENGKHELFERPVLIVKKINKELFIGVPLTTKYNDEYFKFSVGKFNGENNYVLWQQIRILSSKRLEERIADIDRQFFVQVRKIIGLLF